MKQKYKPKSFRKKSHDLIQTINEIVDEYAADGYDLTLRQSFYQLVARGYVENTERSYKNIGNLINDARLAGLIDWEKITDRTRFLRSRNHWQYPDEIVADAAASYSVDMWGEQPYYIEVWIEKDALIDIVAKACEPLDVPYFSCRGYVSSSEMWSASQRFLTAEKRGKNSIIIYLGDHDPSGLDMPRDIRERLTTFGAGVTVNRIALSMEQIKTYNPPPNPAKITDTRADGYIKKFGSESWELDALEPQMMERLITSEILALRDEEIYHATCERERQQKSELYLLADNYNTAMQLLKNAI